MQLLMRRPEITGFISVTPPANIYDFSFLAPCPSSGLMVQGDRDDIVPHEAVAKLVDDCLHEAAQRWGPGCGVRFISDTTIIGSWSDAKAAAV